jgi:hypothetical protein
MNEIRSWVCATAMLLGLSAQAAEPELVGKYRVKIGKPGNSMEMQLECKSETSCIFTTISQWEKDPPAKETKKLDKVSPVTELKYVSNALNYAIGQRSAKIKNDEFGLPMALLRPVLAANPTIGKCWDLNHSTETYMLVCTLDKTPKGSAPLYLFGTLMANCGEGFCGYVIYPLSPP